MSEAAKAIVGEWLEQFPLPELVVRDAEHPEVSTLSEILAVVGPRRAGKTFFFFQIIRDLIEKRGVARDRILFVDFEDYRMSYLGKDPAGELLTAFEHLTGHAPEYHFFSTRFSSWPIGVASCELSTIGVPSKFSSAGAIRNS
jgi:hypothetical protein